ncbi:glycosyltransferase family 4 protein [Sphingomonas sanguinis]|uniref:Glycosyltransferase family 4 protein n=1 Tax=Sphingomonas sanguinis TaxID=33051 RepID=A0ABU5LST9_9SPHN|nr:glycosyltransferase [Sphingomonas sanguinis]MDZ7283003.1 glycosyltransferase family 4 protein [Sphingomonas sanguinis]
MDQPESPNSKKTILFFFNGSFVNCENGAQWRAYSSLSYLVRQGFSVRVYSYSNYKVRPWHQADIAAFANHFPKATLHLERCSRGLAILAKAKKFLSGLLPTWTPWLMRMSMPGLTPIYDQLRAAGIDAVFVNYTTGTLDLNGLEPGRVIVDTHDLLFVQFAKRTGRSIFAGRVIQKFRSETSLLTACAATIGIANADTALFRLCLGDKPILFIPDFGTIRVAQTRSNQASIGRLLFVGSDNPFNVEGLAHFLATWSDLVEQIGLDVAGKVSRHPDVVSATTSISNIRLLGYVDDLGALYANARAVISPVDGTGIKIKVLEALAAGVPVFGSAHTLQGLPPDHDGCVFPIDEVMPALLGDPERLKHASQAAYAWSSSLAVSSGLTDLAVMLHHLTTRRQHR